MSENCECGDCVRAGVERPVVAPFGVELHGVELRDWWAARDQFQRAVEALKDGPIKTAALRLVRTK